MKRSLVVAFFLALSGCSHTAVYRTKGPSESIARRACEEMGHYQPGPDAFTFKCLGYHSVELFSVRFGGDVFRVFGNAHAQTEVAIVLGQSREWVVLVDFK
jgi:hypothetical protein